MTYCSGGHSKGLNIEFNAILFDENKEYHFNCVIGSNYLLPNPHSSRIFQFKNRCGHPLIGPKRVIVHFNIDWTPEGDLGEKEDEIQRQRILDTQNDLLNKVPVYKIIAKYKFTPSIAISVDSIFLPYIASFSYVDSIRQDRPISLMSSG